MDLAHLLTQPEGKTLEFKRDLSSPEKVLRALIAFANTAGGILIIGVEDGTKNVLGVSDPLKEEERLANLVSDRILPRLVPAIEIVTWRSLQVIVVEVYPSPNQPHYLKSLGLGAGAFVRVGSTNRCADAALVEEMRRMVRNETYDESPLPRIDSEAVDLRVASELFRSVRALDRAGLQALRALVPHQRRLVPTVGGLLLFGKSPQDEFPDAWIQCGRFVGSEKSHLADSIECRGVLPNSLVSAYAFIEKHAMRSTKVEGLKSSESSNIPLRAARELLVNAVVHADYSQRGAPIRVAIFDERIEIESPGMLLSGLTVADIRHGVSRLRNRVIGRVFKELSYIEQWGSGIQRAASDCRELGLPEPQFEEFAFRFRATISLVNDRAPQMSPPLLAIRSALLDPKAKEGLSSQQIADQIGIATRTVRTHMAKLAGQGLVRAIGKNARDPGRRYLWISR